MVVNLQCWGFFISKSKRTPFFGGLFLKKEVMLKRGLEIWENTTPSFPVCEPCSSFFHEKE